MNKDTVIALAREAGMEVNKDLDDWSVPVWQVGVDYLERFAALVAAHEREECAKVCESEWSNVAERMYGDECAAAIRSRT